MNQIPTAVLIIEGDEDNSLELNNLYGGETLLGRSLIALSKSGTERAIILCMENVRSQVEGAIRRVNPKRISLSAEIVTIRRKMGEEISGLADKVGVPLLIVPIRSMIHPTLIRQLGSLGRSYIPVYEGVTFNNDRIQPGGELKSKFKVLFSDRGWLPVVANSDQVTATGTGELVSGPLLVLDPGDAAVGADATDFESLIRSLANSGRLFIHKVRDAWWYPVTRETPKQALREVFWRMAFKEISGEFSKAVNSKLSRPLSLWLADREVAPDTISNASLVLFIVSSLLLLIPEYWALITFAVVWQLSAGVLDRCDGEVARIRNYESEHGGRFDMIIDDLRFILPFICLGAMLSYHHNTGYLVPLGVILIWTLALTFYEQAYMLKTGYTSRQVLYVDYLKLIGEKKSEPHKKYLPLIKGDIRTFYVTVLAFFGHRPAVFLVLSAYLTVVPLVSYFGIQKFKKAGIGTAP